MQMLTRQSLNWFKMRLLKMGACLLLWLMMQQMKLRLPRTGMSSMLLQRNGSHTATMITRSVIASMTKVFRSWVRRSNMAGLYHCMTRHLSGKIRSWGRVLPTVDYLPPVLVKIETDAQSSVLTKKRIPRQNDMKRSGDMKSPIEARWVHPSLRSFIPASNVAPVALFFGLSSTGVKGSHKIRIIRSLVRISTSRVRYFAR